MRARRFAIAIVVLTAVAAVAQTDATFKLLLRVPGAENLYVGEPLIVEYACMTTDDAAVHSYCTPEFHVLPLDSTGKLTVDGFRKDSMETGLCGGYGWAFCGTEPGGGGEVPLLTATAEPHWKMIEVSQHVPATAGRFEVSAAVNGMLGGKDLLATAKVIIELTETSEQHATRLHYGGCITDSSLGVTPEPDAVAALRTHLGECAKLGSDTLRIALNEVVTLRAQTEPNINWFFMRIAQLEGTDYPREAGSRSNSTEKDEIRSALRKLYRESLRDTAKDLIRAKQQGEPVKAGFRAWKDVASRPICARGQSFLSPKEVQATLRRAGLDEAALARK